MTPKRGDEGCVPDPTRHVLRWLQALVALLGAGAWMPVPVAQAACTAAPGTELPLTLRHRFLLVPASLDGGQTMLVVDTGAEATTVTPETAAGLHLASEPSRTMLLGVGGAVLSGGTVRLHRLVLGRLHVDGLSPDVGRLPRLHGAGLPVGGLLGLDVLGGYDIALDLPRRSMTLYAVPSCPGFVPPDYSAADGEELRRTRGRLLVIAVRIDGHPVRALLDTGARTSLLERDAAARLGVTGEALARDQVMRGSGIGAQAVALRRHRFGEVRVGGVAVRNMEVDIGPLPVPGVDMLLGADWLAGHVVWISRAAGRLFQR